MKLPPLSLFICFALIHPSVASLAVAAGEVSQPLPYTDVDVKPTPKRPVKIRFPSSVRKKGEIAEVVLRFIVTGDGEVQKVVVVKFSHPDMIEPALLAYESAKYNPGMKNGRPVATLMEVREAYPSK